MNDVADRSSVLEFKNKALKLIENEIKDMYTKSPQTLGKKHWVDVWKRLQALNSRVQIFDHPMKFQPILDFLWGKYAQLVEETNLILKPYNETAKTINQEDDDEDSEEEPVFTNNAVNF